MSPLLYNIHMICNLEDQDVSLLYNIHMICNLEDQSPFYIIYI